MILYYNSRLDALPVMLFQLTLFDCFISALLGVASTSGYQMVVNVGEAKQIKDTAITSLQVFM